MGAMPVQVPRKPVPAPPELSKTTVVIEKDKTVRIIGLQKAMTKTMSAALLIPHFGYCDEIDITMLVNLRKDLKRVAAERGIKFSYMPVFIKVKEGIVLFNDALNTVYLRLYSIGHKVTDHSDCEKGNLLPPHGLLFPISTGVLLYASSHRQDNIPRPLLHQSWEY